MVNRPGGKTGPRRGPKALRRATPNGALTDVTLTPDAGTLTFPGGAGNVTFDKAAGNLVTGAVSINDVTINPVAAGAVLVALIGNDNTLTVNSVAYTAGGSGSWTKIGSVVSGNRELEIWVNSTPAVGSNTIRTTYSANLGATDGVAVVLSFLGGTSTVANTYTSDNVGTAPTITLTASAGAMIAAMAVANGALSPVLSGTEDYNNVNNDFWNVAHKLGSGSTTITWTGTVNARGLNAVNIPAAPGGQTPILLPGSTEDALTGSLVLTGITPTVTTTGGSNTTITPTAGTFVLTGAAPSIIRDDTITPAAGTITLSGIAPVVTQGFLITPAVGGLTITGPPPVLISGTAIIPTAGSLVLSGAALVITRQDTSTPTAGVLVLTGIAPSVTRQNTIQLNVGALTLSGNAPVIIRQDTLQPAAGVLVFTGSAPSNGSALSQTPSAGSLVLSGVAPSVIRQDTIQPNTGALAFTGAAPGVTRQDTTQPAAGVLTLSGQAAVSFQPIIRTPVAGSLGLTGGISTLTIASSSIQPGTGSLVLSSGQVYIAAPPAVIARFVLAGRTVILQNYRR